MVRDTSFSLDDHLADFIDRQIVQGRYGSVSDVVRAGLRLLEENEMKVEALQAALIAGEDSGPVQFFDVEDFLNAKRSRRAE